MPDRAENGDARHEPRAAMLRPTELRVSRDRKSLTVSFADGNRFELPAEMLRVLSPSAEVQGHNPSQRKVIAGKRQVEMIKVVPIGNYAVRIGFDDLHDTGIYTWSFLRDLGENLGERIKEYDREIDEKGLSRDR